MVISRFALLCGTDMSETLDSYSHELDIYKCRPPAAGSEDEGGDGYLSSEFADDSLDGRGPDLTFEKIKQSVHSSINDGKSYLDRETTGSLAQNSEEGDAVPGHCALSFGFIPKGYYEHPIKNGAILGSK